MAEIINDDWTKKHEGLRLHVYHDSRGIKTVGFGHNLQGGNNTHVVAVGASPSSLIDGDTSLTQAQADQLFQLDMADLRAAVKKLVPEYDTMPAQVQGILSDLCFNMGFGTLSKFHGTLNAIRQRRYSDAADSLADSLWYRQVKCRSKAIVEALRQVKDGSIGSKMEHVADNATTSIWSIIFKFLTKF